MRSPVGRYFGGKSYLAKTIVELFPPHTCYCEPFAGSAQVLFAKEPSPVECINDLDGGIVNFFRVIRNPEQAAKLKWLLDMTPYAREEYYHCGDTWHTVADPVEKARRWFAFSQSAFSGLQRGNGAAASGWAYSCERDQAHTYRTLIDRIMPACERLRDVQIDNRPAASVIKAWDSPATLFYCDPPYVLHTRTGKDRYFYEMTWLDHARLLRLLNTVQGMVILSGYNSPLYDKMLHNWQKMEIETVAHSMGATRSIGKGQGHRSTKAKRTEVIWLNPACVKTRESLQLSMFGEVAL